MNRSIDYDRRKPLPENFIFEAHDDYDPTANHFFYAFRNDDASVTLSFLEDKGSPHGLDVLNSIGITAEQCEQLGAALLKAAEVLRTQVGK